MVKTIIIIVIILIWLYIIFRLLRFIGQAIGQTRKDRQMALPEGVYEQLQPAIMAISSWDHESALRYLDQLASSDLDTVTLAWMHGLRAEILKRQGDIEAEIKELTLAIEADPTAHEFHNNLGAAYWRQGRLSEAEQALTAALEIFPHYANAHCNLGSVYEEMGQIEDAAVHYRRALTLAPDDMRAQQGLQRVAGMSESQPDPKLTTPGC
jgi:Flp pilus assembly protein TadD